MNQFVEKVAGFIRVPVVFLVFEALMARESCE